MLLTLLALTSAFAPAPAPIAPTLTQAYVLECQVEGRGLTDCKVVDGEAAGATDALRMAADIRVPDAVAQGDRIRIRLNLNP